MKTMIVETSQLESICQRILDKLKFLDIRQIEVSQDMYWELTAKQAYDMKFEVDQPNIGSLADDWSMLLKLVDKPERTTFVDFDRLAAILKAISEELNPEE